MMTSATQRWRASNVFAFLRTFKSMLKRARGTEHYDDIRLLLQLKLHANRVERLLVGQNDRLYEAARTRDALLSTRNK